MRNGLRTNIGHSKSLRWAGLAAKFCQMKTLRTREFTRQFSRYRTEACLVKDRDKILGTWTPAPGKPQPVNFAERVRKDFKQKLPFTFAELLKAGKKR